MPGMDGTGDLFREFVGFLPQSCEVLIVQYPTKEALPYAMLEGLARAACSGTVPFVLVAESFSTPLALRLAASNPPGLRGMVLCAGFATTPVKVWGRILFPLLAALVFHFPLPTFVAKRWLVGPTAPQSLLDAVRKAVSLVEPEVMASRLRAVLACDVREAASQIDVPVLYIRATRDRLVDSLAMEELRQLNPRMAVTELEGPHLLLQREPQRTATVVLNFFRELPVSY